MPRGAHTPKVSVVMPVRDVAPFVGDAIDSVLGQTLGDLELIVVEDGSTDGTLDVVRSFGDARIRILHGGGRGVAAAAGQGLRAALGEYVSRLDGDDVALPGLLERQAAVLDAHAGTAAVGTWVRRFGGAQEASRCPTEPAALRRGLRRASVLQQPALLRRSAAVQVGGYRAVRWEDWDLWVRLATRWDLRAVPEYLALIRVRGGSRYWATPRARKQVANLRVQGEAARHLGLDGRSVAALAAGLARLPALAVLDATRPARRPPQLPAQPPPVTVALTSAGRPQLLGRCLAAIAAQEPPPAEVVVAHGAGDAPTAKLLAEWAAVDPQLRRVVTAPEGGIVAGLQAATEAARQPVVAFVDDDAAPRPGWLAELRRGFLDPTVAGVGGRFVDHVGDRVVSGSTGRVGYVTWYGRVVGRHDLDTDYHGDVELLAGANMAFRRQLVRHDDRLQHTRHGLALANELDTCLTIRRRGGRLVYSPWAVVDHYTTSFRDPVLGSRVAGDDVRTSAANYTYALLKYLPPWRRPAFLAYALLVGSSTTPGLLRPLAELRGDRRRARAMAQRLPAAWRGRVQGIGMYRRWRRGPETA